jgi:hypothetical protein
MPREFTEQEVMSVITAVVKAERGCAKAERARFRREVVRATERMADGNARLLAYARTGDLSCLDAN